MTQLWAGSTNEVNGVKELTLCVPFLLFAFLSSGLWRDGGRMLARGGRGGTVGGLGSYDWGRGGRGGTESSSCGSYRA